MHPLHNQLLALFMFIPWAFTMAQNPSMPDYDKPWVEPKPMGLPMRFALKVQPIGIALGISTLGSFSVDQIQSPGFYNLEFEYPVHERVSLVGGLGFRHMHRDWRNTSYIWQFTFYRGWKMVTGVRIYRRPFQQGWYFQPSFRHIASHYVNGTNNETGNFEVGWTNRKQSSIGSLRIGHQLRPGTNHRFTLDFAAGPSVTYKVGDGFYDMDPVAESDFVEIRVWPFRSWNVPRKVLLGLDFAFGVGWAF